MYKILCVCRAFHNCAKDIELYIRYVVSRVIFFDIGWNLIRMKAEKTEEKPCHSFRTRLVNK